MIDMYFASMKMLQEQMLIFPKIRMTRPHRRPICPYFLPVSGYSQVIL